jgi:hypothetical protein
VQASNTTAKNLFENLNYEKQKETPRQKETQKQLQPLQYTEEKTNTTL